MDWLTVAASKEGQEAFNPLKGSICARTDCDPKLFSEYSQGAAKDWLSSTVVGSLMHGVVAAPAWATSIGTAIGLFQASAMDAGAQATFQTHLLLPANQTVPASRNTKSTNFMKWAAHSEPPIS